MTPSPQPASAPALSKVPQPAGLVAAPSATWRTVVGVLNSLNAAVFAQFRTNPEHFIAKARRLINEQKAKMNVEHLAYDLVDERYERVDGLGQLAATRLAAAGH